MARPHHRRNSDSSSSSSSSSSDSDSEAEERTPPRTRDVVYSSSHRGSFDSNDRREHTQSPYRGTPEPSISRDYGTYSTPQGQWAQQSFNGSPSLLPNYQRPPSAGYSAGQYRAPSPHQQPGPPRVYQQRPPQDPPYRPPPGPPPSHQLQSQHPPYRPPPGPPPSYRHQPQDVQYRPPPGPPPSHQYHANYRQDPQSDYHNSQQSYSNGQYQQFDTRPASSSGRPGGYIGGPPTQAEHPYTLTSDTLRRKSLLIGINYVGTKQALRGCQQDVTNMREFIGSKGYSTDHRSQVIMRDDHSTDPRGPFWPTGRNILAAMRWLVSEPNTCTFLHYSGHGSQIPDPDAARDSGYVDTIVPIDFESAGQISSATLHRTLVSALHPTSTLFVIFDCCHSGSALELPFVYRSDQDGNVSLLDNIATGIQLAEEAGRLFDGGFTVEKLAHASELYAGAHTFFKQLSHMGDEAGLGDDDRFAEGWSAEHRFVTMFSGCRDDQTSADATIGGASVGAMSWAFLETMKRNPCPTFLSTLQQTRAVLGESRYKQVPQLSIGVKEIDLDGPLRF